MIILDFPCGSNRITRVLLRGRQEDQRGSRSFYSRSKRWLELCEKKGHEPRNARELFKLEKARKWILPIESPERTSPANALVLAQ